MERLDKQPRDSFFLIDKVSGYEEDQPHGEAYKVEVIQIDYRPVDDPGKLSIGQDWYGRGTNHRVHNGWICRDMGYETKWAIDIQDLVAFTRSLECGKVILSIDTELDSQFQHLTIYDDYIE